MSSTPCARTRKLRLRDLRVDGGAAANDFLCRFQAGILGLPVVRPRTVETTALGAAYLAGLGVGYWTGTAEIEKTRRGDLIFPPEMARSRARALYAGWRAAVSRTLSRR